MHQFVYSPGVASATIGLVSVLFLATIVELRLKPRKSRFDRTFSNVMVILIGLFVALDCLVNLRAIGIGGAEGLEAFSDLIYTYVLVIGMTISLTVRAITRKPKADTETGRHPEG
jgi:hypothetical protein